MIAVNDRWMNRWIDEWIMNNRWMNKNEPISAHKWKSFTVIL